MNWLRRIFKRQRKPPCYCGRVAKQGTLPAALERMLEEEERAK